MAEGAEELRLKVSTVEQAQSARLKSQIAKDLVLVDEELGNIDKRLQG